MRFALTTVLALTLASGTATARPEIGPGAFTPAATLIDFDDLMGGQTIQTGDLVNTQYLGLGAEFRNPNFESRANSNLAALFATQSDPNVCFNFQGGGGVPGSPPVEIHFTVPVLKVGMWYGTSANSTCTLEVYNGGTLLESLTKRGDPLGSFGLEGFIGIERPELITMVKISSRSDNPNFGPFNFSIDDVRFEGEEPCYPDCDTQSGPGVLDIFDFLCFGNRFAANDPYACDCDMSTGPGVCDIFDFLCFGNAFSGGCP